MPTQNCDQKPSGEDKSVSNHLVGAQRGKVSALAKKFNGNAKSSDLSTTLSGPNLSSNGTGKNAWKVDRENSSRVLKPKAIRQLFNQSFMVVEEYRAAECFKKLLTVNTDFLEAASGTYRFGIFVYTDRTEFCLSNNKSRKQRFRLSKGKTAKLMNLLKPSVVYVQFCSVSVTQDLYELLTSTNAKIGIHLDRMNDQVVEFMKRFAQRIVELKCAVPDLMSNLPSINYEHISVSNIQTMGQLSNVLKQNTDELTLKLNNHFQVSGTVVKNVGRVSACTLVARNQAVLGMTSLLVKNCLALKELVVVSSGGGWFEDSMEPTAIVKKIVEDCKVYKQVNQVLQKVGIASTVSVVLKYRGGYLQLPEGWFNPLLADADLALVHGETTINYKEVTTKFSSKQRVQGNHGQLFIELNYCCDETESAGKTT